MASQFSNNLHNFELTKRPRTYKPSSQRTGASPATPLSQPLVSSPHQSPPRDSPVIQSRVSPVQGDSSKSSLKEALIIFNRREALNDQRKSKCENSPGKSKASADDKPTGKRSKILIKLPSKMNKEEGKTRSSDHERERDMVLRNDINDNKKKVGGSDGDKKEKCGSNGGIKTLRDGEGSKEKVGVMRKTRMKKWWKTWRIKVEMEGNKNLALQFPRGRGGYVRPYGIYADQASKEHSHEFKSSPTLDERGCLWRL